MEQQESVVRLQELHAVEYGLSVDFQARVESVEHLLRHAKVDLKCDACTEYDKGIVQKILLLLLVKSKGVGLTSHLDVLVDPKVDSS